MNIKRNRIQVLIFLLIVYSVILPLGNNRSKNITSEAEIQENVHYSAQQSGTTQWIKNPNFESPIEPIWFWKNGSLGDNSDMDGNTTTGQANIRVLGDSKTFTVVSGNINSSNSPGWKRFRNGDYQFPNISEIRSYGAFVYHEWADGPNQAPSVHWKTNVSVPIDMSDYVITSASLEVIVNATVSSNVDTPNDDGSWTNYAIGDSVTFYIQISDLGYNAPIYTVASNKTKYLGQQNATQPTILTIDNNPLETVNEIDLITALNSAFDKDPQHSNFTITAGIDIYSEDNLPGTDTDTFDELIIKNITLTFTAKKKIDQYTKVSWNQVGNKLNGSSFEIVNASFNFKYKVNKAWPSSAPLSEIKFYIDNKSHPQGTFKLSSAPISFQYAKPGGFDVTNLVSTDVNISTSIEVFLKDSFELNETLQISIANVTLNISYIETFPDYNTDFRLFLNGNNKTSNPVFQLPINNLLNISFKYINQSKIHITNATIQLEGEVTGALGENITFQQYDITINSSNLGIGISILTIVAQKNNYETQNLQIFVEVTERTTELQLYINDNPTTDKSTTSAKFNEFINVTIDYTDFETTNNILEANVNLLGIGQLNETNNQYNITLDTTTFDIGINIFTLYAQKVNYQLQTIQFFIEVFELESELVLKVNNSQKFDDDTIQVKFNEHINITVYYKDNITKEHITGGGVNLLGISNLTEQISYYDIIINSNIFAVGINVLTIYAQLDGYKSQSIHFFIEVFELESELVLKVNNSQKFDGATIQVNFNEFINISIYYKDNSTKEHITGAGVSLLGIENLTEQTSYYDIIINSNIFVLGINVLTIYAQLNGYKSQSIQIFIDIDEVGTNLLLYVNEKQFFDSDTVQVQLNEIINISVFYKDNLRDIYITGASVSLFGIGNLIENTSKYTIIINSNVLDLGINVLTIYAQLNGYKSQSIHFFIEVFERALNLNLFLNGENKTIDRVFDLPITSSLNITIKLYDNQTRSHINKAILQLIGEGLLTNFTENSALQQYSLILDTSDLNVGVKLFSIIALATDYKAITLDIRVTITRINTNINTVTGESFLNAKSGENFRLKVLLNNTDFGGIIKGATVSFIWEYGLGELTDPDDDGVYEITLQNVKGGSHIITITAFAGDLYELKTYEIVLNVIAESELDLTWIVIGLTGGIMGLVSVFISYQKHFKYPRIVRKVRKLRKNIKKGKKTKPMLIAKREDIITNNLQATIQILTLETLDPKKNDTKLKSSAVKDDENYIKKGEIPPNK